MNIREVAIIMRGVRALCPAQKFDEFSPEMWEAVLVDTQFADAKTAIIALGRTQTFIAPGEICTEVKRMRVDRVRRAPMPCPNVAGGDEIRAIERAMADGRIATEADAYAYERWGGSLHEAYLVGRLPELEGSPAPIGNPEKVRLAIANTFRRVPRAD